MHGETVKFINIVFLSIVRQIPLLLNLPRTTTFQNPTLRAIYFHVSVLSDIIKSQ